MTSKEKYRKLCEVEPSIPIYSRAWWLDAVVPEAWDVVTVEKNEEIVAALPYAIKKHYGFIHICMPPLTQKLGPWLKYPAGQKYSKKLDYEKKTFNELIKKLPAVDVFDQNFDYHIENWLPFYWQGFSQSTRYTYVIPDLSDVDKIYNELASDIRKQLRKSEKLVSCEVTEDVDLLYDVAKKTFVRQNMQIPYSREFLHRLVEAAKAHSAGRIYVAKDRENRVHAVSFLIWDENSAYYLIGGADPELRQSSAQVALMWRMIQDSAKVTKAFDFEGTMLPTVNRTFRNFATVQYPYFNISKTYNKRLKGLQHVKEILRILRGQN